MTVGELYDTVENVRFQVVKYNPLALEETIEFDDGNEIMCNEGLDEQIEFTEVEVVTSHYDHREGEIILQALIF